MRNIFAAVLMISLAAAPAFAQTYAEQKDVVAKNSKQETIALGNNRFMMFNGTFAEYQYVYSIDLIKIDGGIPHYEPLFMEEYDPRSKSVVLSDGTAFPSLDYHFDKTSGILDYTAKDEPDSTPKEYKYQLKGDTLMLQEIRMPAKDGAPPKIIFDATQKHAETH